MVSQEAGRIVAAEQPTNTWGGATVNLEMSPQQYTKQNFREEQVAVLLRETFDETQLKALGEPFQLALSRLKTGLRHMNTNDKMIAHCVITTHSGSYVQRQRSLLYSISKSAGEDKVSTTGKGKNRRPVAWPEILQQYRNHLETLEEQVTGEMQTNSYEQLVSQAAQEEADALERYPFLERYYPTEWSPEETTQQVS
jgi:hypothetical protein